MRAPRCPAPVNVTESAVEGQPGHLRVVPLRPPLLGRARRRTLNAPESHASTVRVWPWFFSKDNLCSSHSDREPLSSRGLLLCPPGSKWLLCGAPAWAGSGRPPPGPEPKSVSTRSLGAGPSEEARRPPRLPQAGSAWWWPAVGSSGPARSSRRCPSSAAAAAGEWSGSTGH